MFERIYTIPVNEAFDAAREAGIGVCPFCHLHKTLQEKELDLILGASMMEPDIRIQTNQKGFCKKHFASMLAAKNKLGLALILESHLAQVRDEVKDTLLQKKGSRAVSGIASFEKSCYICDRVEHAFSKMVDTAAYLHEQDADFREKFCAQGALCLTHYRRLLLSAKQLSKKSCARLIEDAQQVFFGYFDSVQADVSHFCKKFDYRYDAEPWGNAKDAPERAIRFLKSEE